MDRRAQIGPFQDGQRLQVSLAEERDRRQQGQAPFVVRLRESADRNRAPIRGHDPTPFRLDPA